MQRRSREEILVRILKSCASDGVGITRLMFSQNLSYNLLKEYLHSLQSRELVRIDGAKGRTVVTTTVRGLTVLKCYRNGVALLNGHPAGCPLLGSGQK